MKRSFMSIIAISATAIGLLAQDQPPQDPQGPDQDDQQQQVQEPDGQYEQGRGVARISVLNGDVSVRRGDSGDVVAAAINAPLMANDSILTSSSSRAEVQLDWGNVLRIGPNSEVRFTGVDVKSFQIQVAAGTVTYRILRASQAQAEVDTPSVAVHPLGQGIYRIGVRDDGTSEITVRSGDAEIFSQKGSERLGAGHTMYARGAASDPEFQVIGALAPDSWDRWNDERDQYMLRSRAYDHVSRDVPGAEDLDQYGQWKNDPNYGSVWQPNVDPGWAPYQAGRWAWEDYYGWTWVSSDPWGWAPYHYGRWFNGGAGWCWYPGPIYSHYNWAPAYVGFFGYGGRGGFGFGFGGLGWVALAPFERYHPWYGRGFYGGFHSGAFARNSVILNNRNIPNVYRNARNGGAMGVNANDFGRGRSQFQRLNGSQIQSAGVVHGAVPLSPGRSSLQFSNRAASGNIPQRNAQTFASHMQAPQVNRASFTQQQRGMQQISRGEFSAPSRSSASPASPAGNSGFSPSRSGSPSVEASRGNGSNGVSRSAGSGSSTQSTHGWDRFGQPVHGSSSSAASNGASRPSTSGGWQRYDNTRPSSGGSSNSSASPSRGFGYSGSGSGQAIHISPPMVQQRSGGSSPSYQSPSRGYSPSYQAPSRSASPSYSSPRSSAPSYQSPSRGYSPSYQAPRSSSPSYSAPRNSGGSAPRSSAPSRSSGGSSSHASGGGGRSSGGGGGHHR